MSKVYFMMGLPGAGKSTYIKNFLSGLPVVSRDQIRADLGYTSSAQVKTVLNPTAEKEVTKVQHQNIDFFCSIGRDFVIDGINNRRIYRDDIIEIARRYDNVKIVFIHIKTPLSTCIQRRDGQIKAESMQFIESTFDYPDISEYDELIEVAGIKNE